MDILFYICAGVLYAVSLATGYSYKEVSVFINVYFQSLFLLFSAVYLLACSMRLLRNHKIIFFSILPWIVVQLFGFYSFSKRYYGKPDDLIFDQTMKGLQELAKFLHITYFSLNIMLYVFLYCSIILINFAVSGLIKKLDIQNVK